MVRILFLKVLLLCSPILCLGQLSVGFNSTPSSSNGTILICEGSVISFIDASSNIPQGANLNWTFNGGNTATAVGAGPHDVAYNSVGTYAAILEINGQQEIVQIIVAQSYNTNLVASGPQITTSSFGGITVFRRCNNNIQNWTFTFNDPNISSYPLGTIFSLDWGDGTNPGNSFPAIHNYPPGEFDLTYTVTFPNGCSEVRNYAVYNGSTPPALTISGSGLSFCKPNDYEIIISAPFEPPATTYTIQVNDGSAPIILEGLASLPYSYFHNFNVNSCGTTTLINSNPYQDSYSIQVTATNGCNVNGTFAAIGPIQVSESVVANFELDNQIVCVGQTVTATDISMPGANVIQGYCDSLYGIFWELSPASGVLVSGTYGNGGNYILDATQQNYNWYGWTNGTDELEISFPVEGEYELTLFIGNDCGVDSISRIICVVPEVIADFEIPTQPQCSPFELMPINNSSLPGCNLQNFYNWSITRTNPENCPFGNNPGYQFINGSNSNDFQPEILFNSPGEYEIRLIVGLSGSLAGSLCDPDTMIKFITIKDIPFGTLQPIQVCVEDEVVVTVGSLNSCYSELVPNYSWDFGATPPASIGSSNVASPLVSFDQAGTYPYSVVLSNECGDFNANQTITVFPEVFVEALGPQGSCLNSTIQLQGSITGAVTTGTWTASVSGGTFIPSANSLNPQYTLPLGYIGTIIFTLTSLDPVGPCPSASAIHTVTIDPDATVNAGTYANFCTNQAVQLNAVFGGAASSITWNSNGLGTFSDVNDPLSAYTPPVGFSGTITLSIETNDPNGPCQAASDQATLTFIPVAQVNAGVDNSLCQNGSIQLNGIFGGSATGGTWSSLSGGTFTPSSNVPSPVWTPNPSFSGNASLVFTSQGMNPCPAVTDVIDLFVHPIPFIGDESLIICSGETFTYSPTNSSGNIIPPGTTYTWQFIDNQNISGESNSTNALSSIEQSLVNLSAVPQTVLYNITPVSGSSALCLGETFILSVTVNPGPSVVQVPDLQVCTNETVNIVFQGVAT